MSENITDLTDDSFEAEVIKAELPVLVDFWAPWCGPCKAVAPLLEEIAAEYVGKLKVCKLNVDRNEVTAPKFNVRGIPTLTFFKGGEAVASKVGQQTRSQLAAFIDSHL